MNIKVDHLPEVILPKIEIKNFPWQKNLPSSTAKPPLARHASLAASFSSLSSPLFSFLSSPSPSALSSVLRRPLPTRSSSTHAGPLPTNQPLASIPKVKVSHATAATIDADAAMQASSAFGQIAVGIGQAGAAGYANALHIGAESLAKRPLEGLLGQMQPLGPAGFGLNTGIAALGLPCTAITLVCALHDIADAKHFNTLLDTYQNHYQQALNTLDKTLETTSDPKQKHILTGRRIQTEQCLATVNLIKKLNRLDKKGNQYVVAGAASTLASTALTVGAQAGLVGTNSAPSTFAAVGIETAAGLAAAGASIASTALGIPASIGSAGYGLYMMKKSAQQRECFKQSAQKLACMLRVREVEMSLRPEPTQAHIELPYLHFLRTKLQQRRLFLRWFNRSSKGLLAGGITSGVTAAVKGIVIAATVAGASAALANPVVPVLLVVLGALGLGLTAMSSQQVFYRHTKHKRYDRQRLADDVELDRTWLSSFDIWHTGYAKKGFALRARFYQLLEKREQRRQAWLANIAAEQACHFKPAQYSTDRPSALSRTPLALTQKISVPLRTHGSRTLNWLKNATSRTQTDVSSLTTQPTPGTLFDTAALTAWLSESNNRQRKIQWMRLLIGDQTEYLKYKINTRIEAYQQQIKAITAATSSAAPQTALSPAATNAENTEQLFDLFEKFHTHIEQDKLFQKELRQLDSYLAQLEQHPQQDTNKAGMPSLSQLQAWFIELQHGRTWNPAKSYYAAGTDTPQLANYLLHDAPRRARELRGILLESELDAACIRYEEGDEKYQAAKSLKPFSSGLSRSSAH